LTANRYLRAAVAWLLHPVRSWHRRQLFQWEMAYLEALGKRTEIEKGRDSYLWRIAVVNEHQCQQMAEYHRGKSGAHAADITCSGCPHS
jgi:hypothetical protein